MVPEQLVNGINLQDGDGQREGPLTNSKHGCVVHTGIRHIQLW